MLIINSYALKTSLLLLLLTVLPSLAEAARGRPTLNAAHSTFVADNGNLIRGPFATTEWGGPPPLSEIQFVKTRGANAIHLYAEAFEPTYPATGTVAPGYAVSRVDQMVQMTRDEGLYLIITIGNGAYNGQFNYNFIMDFWNFYAPRYKNQTHVIYEIQNEPVAWSPPYPQAALNMQIDAYNLIRTHAPDTPILLFSYSVLNSGTAALQDLNSIGHLIDWNKAAVGFHGYAGVTETTASLEQIRLAGYPCFMTEFAATTWGTGNYKFDPEMAAELERLGISWLTFQNVNFPNIAEDFKDNVNFYNPANRAGLSWTPDYGSWPANRGTHGLGNQFKPWTTTGLTGALRIQAEDFDIGGQNVGSYDLEAINYGGHYRSEGVDVATTTDVGGGYLVGWTQTGEWLEYTIMVTEPGLHTLRLRYTSVASTDVKISIGGEDKTGNWNLPSTNGWGNWTTISRDVELGYGRQKIRIEIVNSNSQLDLNWLELAPITTGPIANGTYKLVNRNSNKAIEVEAASTSDGAKIQQWSFFGGDHQKWTLTHLGAGQYKIIGVQSGKTPNLFYDINGEKALLTPYWGSGTKNQRFIISPTDGGFYRIRNVESGLAVEIESASLSDAAKVQQWEYFNGSHQQWGILTP